MCSYVIKLLPVVYKMQMLCMNEKSSIVKFYSPSSFTDVFNSVSDNRAKRVIRNKASCQSCTSQLGGGQVVRGSNHMSQRCNRAGKPHSDYRKIDKISDIRKIAVIIYLNNVTLP